ncbi:hypothetical protein [Streptomyces albipurpureus]|uniref:Integrase n=1 Tax=Streptomyces albipurpureus TaxID=2897419 RepID=A0ABT0URJ3_9ACTN|nr:hypothetical protein [Streptomyces sp. CWNU-1]MCM2391064.1 hypothetical protein [Streptomyces sp. CWNU-1]
MTVAKLIRKPSQTDARTESTAGSSAEQAPPKKKRLPAGQPREWYVTHNRRLKAMRLAIALLDSGVYHPATADNRRIRTTADRIGIHPPSDTTCRMVRALIRYGR